MRKSQSRWAVAIVWLTASAVSTVWKCPASLVTRVPWWRMHPVGTTNAISQVSRRRSIRPRTVGKGGVSGISRQPTFRRLSVMPKSHFIIIGEPVVDIGSPRYKRRTIKRWGMGVLLTGTLSGCVWLERVTAPAPDPNQVNRGMFFGPEEYPITEPDDPEDEQE